MAKTSKDPFQDTLDKFNEAIEPKPLSGKARITVTSEYVMELDDVDFEDRMLGLDIQSLSEWFWDSAETKDVSIEFVD